MGHNDAALADVELTVRGSPQKRVKPDKNIFCQTAVDDFGSVSRYIFACQV
jgi:hypothetical protein